MKKLQVFYQKYNEPFLLYIFSFVLSCIMICFLKTLWGSDELGTMANAAYLAGEPWSRYLGDTLAYYKYGQAVLYVPLYWISRNPVFVYHGALVINAFIISWIPVMVNYLLCHAFSVNTKYVRRGISVVVALFPAGVLWSKTVFNDTMLMVLPWLVLILIYQYMKARSASRQRLLMGLTAVAAAYAYTVHARGIVLVIATALIVFYLKLVCRRKRIWVFFAVIAALVITDHFLSGFFKQAIWGGGVLNNTVGDTMNKLSIGKLISWNGIKNLIRVSLGWLYSATISTLGLFWIGAAGCLLLFYQRWKNREWKSYQSCFIVFAVLLFAGSMALGIIYFSSASYDIVYSETGDRLDRLIYTRYMDSAVGPFLLLALLSLTAKRIGKITGTVILLSQVTAFFAFYLLTEFFYRAGSLSTYMLSTCPLVLPISGTGIADISNMYKQFVIAEVLTLFCMFSALLSSWFGMRKTLYAIFAAGYLCVIGNGFYRNHYSMGKYYYQELSCFEPFFEGHEELWEEYPEIWITNFRMYYAMQFYYGDYCFSMYLPEEDDGTGERLILDFYYYDGKYSDDCLIIPMDDSGHAVIARGERLIDYIE